MSSRGNAHPGFGALLHELLRDGSDLARQEVRLLRLEMRSRARRYGIGAISVAGGVVLGLIGSITVMVGLVTLPGDQWLRDRYWVAALIVTLVAATLAWLALRRGAIHLNPASLTPDETVETLKEDGEWLKRQLR